MGQISELSHCESKIGVFMHLLPSVIDGIWGWGGRRHQFSRISSPPTLPQKSFRPLKFSHWSYYSDKAEKKWASHWQWSLQTLSHLTVMTENFTALRIPEFISKHNSLLFFNSLTLNSYIQQRFHNSQSPSARNYRSIATNYPYFTTKTKNRK